MIDEIKPKIELSEFETYMWAIRTRMYDAVWRKEKVFFRALLFLGLIGGVVLLVFTVYQEGMTQETKANLEMLGKVYAAFEILTLAVVLLIKVNNRTYYFVRFNEKDMTRIFGSIPEEIQNMVSLFAVIRDPLLDVKNIRAKELNSTLLLLSTLFDPTISRDLPGKSRESKSNLLNTSLSYIRKNDALGFAECILDDLNFVVCEVSKGAK